MKEPLFPVFNFIGNVNNRQRKQFFNLTKFSVTCSICNKPVFEQVGVNFFATQVLWTSTAFEPKPILLGLTQALQQLHKKIIHNIISSSSVVSKM